MYVPAHHMYGYARPLMPQNRHHAPHNHQWRPFHGPHGTFRPRNQGFYNCGPPAIQGVEEHWCETCDKGFPSENLLEKHKQQHQKCNIDGCQFIAHPKVITKHIQMQHSSGIYKKIAKLNNPDEIEKWKEERRKKYPTKTNIEKKAAELKEKIDRGEKMGLGRKEQQNRRDGNNQNMNSRGQGMKGGYNNNNNQPESTFRKPRRQGPKRPKVLPEPEENRSLPPFAGIQSLVMDSDEETDDNLSNNDLIEDDEVATVDDLGVTESEKAINPVVCGALSSLMCEYGSSDEEINDTDKIQYDSNVKNLRNGDTNIKSYMSSKKTLQSKGNQYLPKEVANANELYIKIDAEQKPQEMEKCKNGSKCPKQPSLASCNLNIDNIYTIANRNNDCKQKEVSVKTEKSNTINENDSMFNKPINQNDQVMNEMNTTKTDYDDDSGPEEIKVTKNYEIANSSKDNSKYGSRKMVMKNLEAKIKPVHRKPKPRIPSTLIYRLLSREMKQERNKVLQCIRYVRKNNYFDTSL